MTKPKAKKIQVLPKVPEPVVDPRKVPDTRGITPEQQENFNKHFFRFIMLLVVFVIVGFFVFK